ncbi:MAG: hypothetical protein ABIS25_05365 [Sphingomicrobium sp.]
MPSSIARSLVTGAEKLLDLDSFGVARNHAVAVEGNGVAQARRELGIRIHPVKCTVESGVDDALVRQVRDIGFDSQQRIEGCESGAIRKNEPSTPPSTLFVCITNNRLWGPK